MFGSMLRRFLRLELVTRVACFGRIEGKLRYLQHVAAANWFPSRAFLLLLQLVCVRHNLTGLGGQVFKCGRTATRTGKKPARC